MMVLGFKIVSVLFPALSSFADWPLLSTLQDAKASYDVNDHDRDPMPRSTFDNENK